ncbi:MAG: hypothetical protein ACPGJV_08690 [Bacteriovoracaceae bacterium]
MIEQRAEQAQQSYEPEVEKGFLSDGILSLGGSVFSTVGKVALAIGTTGILMYLFYQLEVIVGLGTVLTGAIAICGGVASMALGNKMSTGSFLDGLLGA